MIKISCEQIIEEIVHDSKFCDFIGVLSLTRFEILIFLRSFQLNILILIIIAVFGKFSWKFRYGVTFVYSNKDTLPYLDEMKLYT